MIDITSEQNWNKRFDKEKVHNKMSFENKIVTIGLILFGICIMINSILIYTFFSILNKM